MLPIFELAELIVETLGYGLIGWTVDLGLIYFPVMILIVTFIVLRQHVRQAKLEEHLFGAPFSQPIRQVATSLAFGLIGGLLASFIMVSMGIALSAEIGIQYVWPVVILLMMVNPRFMCFAYGGGIVGIITLTLRGLALLLPGIDLAGIGLFAGLMAVDLPALMALVGVLHLTEAFLIFVSGHINASPILVESPGGKVVGGFMLQRFWPLPMAALLAVVVSQGEVVGGSIGMPGWWPLLKPMMEPGTGMMLMFSTFPIVAALGYSDIAVSSTPRQKSRWSARNLLLYSLILIALALVAGNWRFLQILPVLFAPFAHEYLIQMGNSREWTSTPLLAAAPRGVKLLTVLPDSPALDQGLESGWIILNVNGTDVNNRYELAQALRIFPGLAELEVLSPTGEASVVRIHQREGRLGLVPVPDGTEEGAFLKIGGKGFLPKLWDRWFGNK